jgi:hypothetical protein
LSASFVVPAIATATGNPYLVKISAVSMEASHCQMIKPGQNSLKNAAELLLRLAGF